jgi:hypothetical protein
MELPANNPPADPKPFKPDATRNKFDVLYEVVGRMSSGDATDAERQWFDQNAPEHWERSSTYGVKPAADPAQQQQPAPAPNPVPPTFDVSKFDGHSLAVASDEKASAIIKDIAKLTDSIDAAAHAAFEAERRRLIDAGVSIDEANTIAKKLADEQQGQLRAKSYEQNEKKLLAAIKELQAAEKSAADFARVYNCIERPQSETLLTLHALGTVERQNYASQLAGANAGALRAAAELSRATGNVTLAAAVFLENGKLPREQRAFANDQLADAMYSKRAVEIHKAHVATRGAVQSAMLYLRELKTGTTTRTSNGKISLGLSRLQAGIETNAAEPSPGKPLGDDHPISRISRGLDKLAAKA